MQGIHSHQPFSEVELPRVVHAGSRTEGGHVGVDRDVSTVDEGLLRPVPDVSAAANLVSEAPGVACRREDTGKGLSG